LGVTLVATKFYTVKVFIVETDLPIELGHMFICLFRSEKKKIPTLEA